MKASALFRNRYVSRLTDQLVQSIIAIENLEKVKRLTNDQLFVMKRRFTPSFLRGKKIKKEIRLLTDQLTALQKELTAMLVNKRRIEIAIFMSKN